LLHSFSDESSSNNFEADTVVVESPASITTARIDINTQLLYKKKHINIIIMISADSLPPKYEETGSGFTGGSDLDLDSNPDEGENYQRFN
jgi:hypothetical protein